ncbi:GEVED domain-containing protein [Dyadobacter alkalitolerans]|uniref:GEVED domain-containing protein n=1 Tax=Dyadobacter alkalitolerans TaxID=492736 RepID=UPI0004032435|nr:GEVED domain-containing protein [Dyadobacter alkalitolerans]
MKLTYTSSSAKGWISMAISAMLLLLGHLVLAQQGSQGNTTIFGGAQMTFFGDHDFINGGGGAQPGVILTERASGNFGVLNFAGDNLTSTGASDAGYVDGYVRKYGAGTFVFPVGDNGFVGQFAASADGTMGSYFHANPNTAVTSNLFTGSDYAALPNGGPFNTSSMGAGVDVVSTIEYWDIDGANATPLTLTWDAGSSIASLTGSDLTKLTIVGWNGTQWEAIPSNVDVTSVLGGNSDLTAGSITTTSPLAPDSYTAYTFASGELALAPLSTIVIAKKAQSEVSPGVDFGFTSNIPSGAAFTLNDDPAFVSLQDVGTGNNNTVWAIAAPASGTGNGGVYYRPAGTSSWITAPGLGTRVDVDLNGTPILVNAQGFMYTWDGTSFIPTTAGTINVFDVGVSAGSIQPAYVLAVNNAGCYTLFRWNGGSSYTGFPNICGSRLDVAPDGSIYVLSETAGQVYHVTVSGDVATIAETYPSQGFSDITVAADGSVWAVNSAQAYRLSGLAWAPDANSGGVFIGSNNGGISVGSDGDTPVLTYNAKAEGPTTMRGRLIQRREDGGWFNDHTVRLSGAGNSIVYNVAPGTYTISENAAPGSWELIKINTAGGAVSTNIPARTATVTVTAGQTAHVEFVNYNIQTSTISNSCGTPFVETFGASGSEAVSSIPSIYTPYHYNEYGAETHTVVNNFQALYYGTVAPDHTAGDVGGYFLNVNGGFGQDEVFRRRFSGLLPGASYSLSLWATNLTNAPGYVVPNLVLEARNLQGGLISAQSTGDIAFTTETDWRQYSMTFVADASGTVDFIIRNNQQVPGINGNDFAIDDITIGIGCDYGDAPDSYSTLTASNGPSHKVTSFLTMGSAIDAELEGTPAVQATGDNVTGLNDEDGISAFPVISGGTTTSVTNYTVNVATVNLTSSTANLCGWIDWNSNGVFEAGEGVCTTVAPATTSATLIWPSATLGGATGTTGVYARFRLTTDPLTTGSINGAAVDGEVEDYFIMFETAMPVTLARFTAAAEGGTVLLTWSTTVEIGSDRFEIERSADGKKWTAIGLVASHGDSKVIVDYAFTDSKPLSGVNLYRLKMVDADETYSLSSIREVKIKGVITVAYPNPVSNRLLINGRDQVKLATMTNVSGIPVLSHNGIPAEGLDVRSLPTGIYTLSLTLFDGTISTHKIAVTR